MNKKIKNASSKEYNGIKFKSLQEVSAYKVLTAAGFEPLYEPYKITIVDGFLPTVPFYTKNKEGQLQINTSKLLGITYTPDFVFDYQGVRVYIEVKGFENDVFPVKKKLFRKWLESQPKSLYFEVWNKRQVLQAIDIIKQYPLYMNKIESIEEQLACLPTEKDRKLAKKFLDNRKFVELDELVYSDVFKAKKKLEEAMDSVDDLDLINELDFDFSSLDSLYTDVHAIAKDFMLPTPEEEFNDEYEHEDYC